jgi:hypothetical protein
MYAANMRTPMPATRRKYPPLTGEKPEVPIQGQELRKGTPKILMIDLR